MQHPSGASRREIADVRVESGLFEIRVVIAAATSSAAVITRQGRSDVFVASPADRVTQ